VPFCARKCDYCAFYSEATSGPLIERYVSALIRELELVAGDLRPTTVFFGGGTPSLLTVGQWERIIAAMDRLRLTGAAEWTVECNPATVSLDKARFLRAAGVNRISLGVQSLDPGLLERLGRVHTRTMALRSFEVLRRAGFDNVNVDLMFAIPGQTLAAWRATLREALALESEHLSCYEVTYEEDTPLYEQLRAGRFQADDDLACAMYEELLGLAAERGFDQYEVSNFARPNGGADGHPPGRACRHNSNYWRGGSYYGLGPSAAGYVGGVRTKNWSSTRLYCEQLEGGRRAIESHDRLSPLARAGEIAGFGLRMNAGWSFRQFLATTGFDLRRDWAVELDRLVQQGWGWLRADGFGLTPVGLRFADAAAEQFLR
ncbi:MAG: radical SAM family heme chaperone HemW, partial [Verrucomicrobia bacterium]|nr:radical SAM family heme chaperone HemW [Verrucomicrobiota bacterium]